MQAPAVPAVTVATPSTPDAPTSSATGPAPASVPAPAPVPVPVPAPAPTNPVAGENAPAKPPRRLSLQSQNQATLEEAFPGIEPAVVRAVLVASRGDLEPAFNALLSMSDPSAVETPPPQPPRPRVAQPPRAEAGVPAEALTSTPQSQLDADALYARQLQEHFGAPAPKPHGDAPGRLPPRPSRKHPNEESDDDYYHEDSDKDRPSFFEEDLPVIKENIKKGFMETQSKVTGWFNEFKKRIENDTSPEASPAGSARSSGQYARPGARRQTGLGDGSRRSRDGGYDADPQVLSDDFTHLNMNDNTGGEFESPLYWILVFLLLFSFLLTTLQQHLGGQRQIPTCSNPPLPLVVYEEYRLRNDPRQLRTMTTSTVLAAPPPTEGARHRQPEGPHQLETANGSR